MNYKSLALAQYLLETCRKDNINFVNPIKLLKLVYIAHGYMLGKHSVPLFDEPILAYNYGPIIDTVYQEVRNYRNLPIDKIWQSENYKKELSDNEKEIIHETIKTYGKVEVIKLMVAMRQNDTPWTITRAIDGDMIISNDYIEFFYKKLLSSKNHYKL